MPSFRCKIKKLRFQGILTDKETERIISALDKAEKTAEWKKISPTGVYECTNCECWSDDKTRCCPTCGRRMKGEEE